MVSLKAKEIFCLIYSGVLFASGLILIGTSAYLLFKIFYHYTFIPSGTVGPFFVIFLLGIAHLLLTWLGIKGPSREHNFHIVLFMILTLILFACEFTVGVWSIILWDEVDVGSIDLITTSFDEQVTLNYYKKDWNKLQSQLHCCGVNGGQDYNKTKNAFPGSCFWNPNGSKGAPIMYDVGCKFPLIHYVKSVLVDGAIIGFLCAFFQGLGIYLFYSFFKSLRQERTERIARRIAMQREMANANAGGQIQSQSTAPLMTAPKNESSSRKKDGVSTSETATPPITPPANAPSVSAPKPS